MNKTLIIKTGSTLPGLKKNKGDFEDWIVAGMKMPAESFKIAYVEQGDPLLHWRDLSGIVITGSHAMITDHHPWSERTADWLATTIEKQIPTLGICYGHQLLAHAL